jgi:hypothetical protein
MGPTDQIHLLTRADASTGTVTTLEGTTMRMVKLHLWTLQQDSSGNRAPIQLPPVWMEPSSALALIEGLNARLQQDFPSEMAAAIRSQGKPPH